LNEITSQVKCFASVVTNAREKNKRNNEDNANEFHFLRIEWFEGEILSSGHLGKHETISEVKFIIDRTSD